MDAKLRCDEDGHMDWKYQGLRKKQPSDLGVDRRANRGGSGHCSRLADPRSPAASEGEARPERGDGGELLRRRRGGEEEAAGSAVRWGGEVAGEGVVVGASSGGGCRERQRRGRRRRPVSGPRLDVTSI